MAKGKVKESDSKVSLKTRKAKKKKKQTTILDHFSSSPPATAPRKPATKPAREPQSTQKTLPGPRSRESKTKVYQYHVPETIDSSEESDQVGVIHFENPQPRLNHVDDDESDDSSDPLELKASSAPSSPRKQIRRPVDSDSDVVEIAGPSAPTPKRVSRVKAAKPLGKKAKAPAPAPTPSPLPPSSPVQIADDSDHSVSPTPARRVRKRQRPVTVSDSDSSAEHIHPSSPAKRRRLIKGKQRARSSADSEDDDEEAGEKRNPHDEDLMAELDPELIIKSTGPKAAKKTAFQISLDRMKRQKKGGKQKALDSDDEEEEDEEEEDDEEDGSELEESSIFQHARPSGLSKYDIGSDDDDDDEENAEEGQGGAQDPEGLDDSFIVEDDGAEQVELPTEFSMDGHQDLSHHFKVICQLFVHMAVYTVSQTKKKRPRSTEEQEEYIQKLKQQNYFLLPLSTVRRKLSGTCDSLVASSVWKPPFRRALDTHPVYSVDMLEESVPICDACHIGGRVATQSFEVTGEAYNKETYRPLSVPKKKKRKQGEFHPTSFSLGQYCARRAGVYHRFRHWEHALYEALEHEVESLYRSDTSGRHNFVKVSWDGKAPDDPKDPDAVMEWLDERGVINREFGRIKVLMKSAHGLDMISKRGDDLHG